MFEMEFLVDGKPVPKGRPRAVARGRFVRMYTPSSTVRWERLVREAAIDALKQHGKTPPMDAPMKVELRFFLFASGKRYKAHPRCDVPPDVDNLAKAVLDALNGVMYNDDSQVIRLIVTKVFCLGRREEGVAIYIGEAL